MSIETVRRSLLYGLFVVPPAIVVALVGIVGDPSDNTKADPLGQQRIIVPSRNADQPDEPLRGPQIPIPTPNGDFATAVPAGIDPESYAELATFVTQAGDRVRVFTGRAAPGTAAVDGTDCVGMRTESFVTLSCGDKYPDGAFHAHQSTFMGKKFLSGLVRPEVEQLLLTDEAGAVKKVDRKNGAFFHEGSGVRLVALGKSNAVVGARALPPPR